MRAQLSVVLVMSAILLVAACELPQPVSATLNVPTFKVHDNAEVTKEGLTVTVNPIGPENIRRFPQVVKRIAWQEADRGGARHDREAISELVPTPSFQVRLGNHTGHVLKLTQTVFRLQDNAGRTYNLFASTSELAAWHESASSTDPLHTLQYQTYIKPQVVSAISVLQLLTRNVELLDGDEWTGYLAFNVNVNSSKEYDAFMASVERLTLRLAEMPTRTDDGGKVVGTTEFTFVLDKVTAPFPVTCPPGTVEPTRESCRQQASLRVRAAL